MKIDGAHVKLYLSGDETRILAGYRSDHQLDKKDAQVLLTKQRQLRNQRRYCRRRTARRLRTEKQGTFLWNNWSQEQMAKRKRARRKHTGKTKRRP